MTQPLSRDDLANLIRAKLEGHEEPPQEENEDDEQLTDDEQSPAGEPHALNSDGLLLGLGSKLGFDATTMTTFTSRDRGLDNPL